MDRQVLQLFPANTSVNQKGRLVIGGCDSVELAEKYGTPLYVLDEEHVRSQCRTFVKAFRQFYPLSRVAYASKALLNRAVAAVICQEGLELDVVSAGELAIALSAGFPPDRIHFHGNNKSPGELEYALENRVGHLVLDSLMETDAVINRLENSVHRPALLLRVTPGVDAHTHRHITTGVSGSKFGMPLEKAAEAIGRLAGHSEINLAGLHCHLGSQIFETGPYVKAMDILLDFTRRMVDGAGFELKELSIGGGFAVNYVPGDNAPPASDYAVAITGSLTAGCQQRGLNGPELIIEPGRSIAGRAGVTLYRAGMQKNIPGFGRYIAVDGGMADNIRPALYGARYTAVPAGRMQTEPVEKVSIMGKYCESADILVQDVMMPGIEPGDIIAVPVTGAYCLPMASNYNGALKAAVVMVDRGRDRLICRREELDDLLRLDIV